MTYIFQTGNNKIKLLTKYESETKRTICYKISTAESFSICAPFIARIMSKPYSIYLQVLSSICGVAL
jgi:hypothetical protein